MTLTKDTATDWHARAAAVQVPSDLFIDGRRVPAASGERYDDVSPLDGRVVAQVAAAGAEDVDRAVRAGRQAFEAGVWAQADPRHRKEVLLRWADLLREHTEELALLETLDVGKPIGDTLAVDVAGAARTIQWYAEALDKTYDEIAPAPRRALAMVTREPLGVVGAVVPWNYPLIISAWKVGPALAAGNSVVLKPAEESPLTALRIAELAVEAGLPDGVLNVVPGLGHVAGAALGRHPHVAKIAFTGSGQVGRYFLQYAAESNAKQVSLELGGKSAQVVLPDADLDAAASAIGWGIYYNAGQTCNAGSRVVAHESVREELLDKVVEFARGFGVGDPLDPTTQMGTLVSAEHRARVMAYVDLAHEEGGRIVAGGRAYEDERGGLFVEPTVVDDVAHHTRTVQEEIFGPVLVVQSAKDVDEAVATANGTAYGLAASVWTRDLSTAHTVARRLHAGTVWVNTFDASDVITPFGGFKESGAGRDKSLHALDAYTQLKTTWIDLG
ncbi:MAG: aldehyde dehydrogenase [Motilibacteraceae bacterium]